MKNASLDQNKKNIISLVLSFIGVLLVGIIIIGISFYGIDRKGKETRELNQYPSELAKAFFQLGVSDSTLVKNRENTLVVTLDTQEAEVNGVDLVLKFDPEKVSINNGGTRVFLFEKVGGKNLKEQEGIYEISAGASAENYSRTYKGRGTFASIPFTLKTTSDTNIEIKCTSGSTTDSNIAILGGDIIDCSKPKVLELKNIRENSDSPTPTPTATPDNDDEDDEDNGGSGGNQNLSNEGSQPVVLPWCKKTPPSRPANLKATTTGKNGQVHLTWDRVSEEATHYTVTYGEKWMDFEYGSPNIGNTDQFNVNGLRNGKLYYFVVTAVNDCASSGYSDGASAYAGWTPGSGTTTTSYSGNNYNSGSNYWGNQTSYGNTSSYGSNPTPTPTVEVSATPEPTTTPIEDLFEDEDDNVGMGDDSYSTLPTATPDPVYVPEDSETGGSNMGKLLPIIGLAVLGLLGLLFVVLTKFARQQSQEV
jgi:hypothetical protein